MHNHRLQKCGHESCLCDFKRYWKVLLIALGIFVLEIVGGLVSSSLVLLSDAGHVAMDSLADITGMVVAYVIYKRWFKSNKARAIGRCTMGALLLIIAGWIIYEAVERFNEGAVAIGTTTMFFIAVLGAIGNRWQKHIIDRGDHNSTNEDMGVHVGWDFWQSVVVIIAAPLIWLTGYTIIDIICSFLIGVAMIYSGCKMIIRARRVWKQ